MARTRLTVIHDAATTEDEGKNHVRDTDGAELVALRPGDDAPIALRRRIVVLVVRGHLGSLLLDDLRVGKRGILNDEWVKGRAEDVGLGPRGGSYIEKSATVDGAERGGDKHTPLLHPCCPLRVLELGILVPIGFFLQRRS